MIKIDLKIKSVSAVNKNNAVLKGLNLFLFAGALVLTQLIFAQRANAETNATGVEIEIIAEPAISNSSNNASNNLVDPVEDLLIDIDNNHVSKNQSTNTKQDDANSDLWARIKDGYAMPNVQSQFATNHETWYASRPDYIKRMIERSQKYLFHIVNEVQKRGMPTEIALLPMIESAFNPQAFSTSKASGIWQFIPSTGKHFGLKQNWWVDNRRDVTAATNAALDYLQKLHGMFGSWDLALAAYNAGEGTVQRAIDKNRRQGLATDYESLSLPPETKNYVPKLQAIKNIITEPEQFGLKIGSIPNRPYFARVTTPKQIDAKLAAQLAEISLDEFSALNPSYNRPVITSTNDKSQLLLPVWAADRFVENLANYDKPLTSWQTYNAKRGERMDAIANKFGTNVNQLRSANGISTNNKLRSAQAMLVPTAFHPSAGVQPSIDVNEMESNNNEVLSEDYTASDEPTRNSRIIYRVKKSETLTVVANKHNITTQALMKINGLKSSKVKVGQSLIIKENSVKSNAKFDKSNLNALKSTGKTKQLKYGDKKVAKIKIASSKHTTRHISARTHIRLR